MANLSVGVPSVVLVKVTLGKKGDVVAAHAISGLGMLIPACLSNAKKWTFQPDARRSAIIIYEFRQGNAPCADRSYSLIRRPNLVVVSLCAGEINYSSGEGKR